MEVPIELLFSLIMDGSTFRDKNIIIFFCIGVFIYRMPIDANVILIQSNDVSCAYAFLLPQAVHKVQVAKK